jgi:hypothetical protein
LATTGALGSLGARGLDETIDRAGMAGDHDLPGAVEVGRLAHLLAAHLGAQPLEHRRLEPHDRGHPPLPLRHRLLHGAAAQVDQLDGVGEAQRAGRDQRAPLAERVPGRDVEGQPALRLERAQDRDRIGEDGRLGVAGEGELLLRALPTELGDGEAERVVGLLEHPACDRELEREVAAHPDPLRTLSGKENRGLHGPPPRR